MTTPTDQFIAAYLAEDDPEKRRDLMLAYAADEATSAERVGSYRYLAGHLLYRLEVALHQRDHARQIAEGYRRQHDAAVPWEVEE